MSCGERAISFDCAGEQLLGVVSLPGQAGNIGVLVIVGGPQYRAGSHRQFVLLARRLAAAGFPVLRFDVRGMGDSTGTFPSFEYMGADIVSAVAALKREVPAIRRVVLWGLCDAASAAMINAANSGDIAGLVLLNPWVRNADTLARAEVKHYYYKRLLNPVFWRKLASGQVSVISSMCEFSSKLIRQLARRHQRTESLAEAGDFRQRMMYGLEKFSGPVLLLLSGQDMVASEFIEFIAEHPRFRNIWKRAGLLRVDLPDADHTFSSSKHRSDVEAATLEWLKRMPHAEKA